MEKLQKKIDEQPIITRRGKVDPKVLKAFLNVLERYPVLKGESIVIRQKPLKSSTMQAQPLIRPGNFLGKKLKYQVKVSVFVRDSQSLKVADLPHDVLVGWFAHELGHIVDYLPRSVWGMIAYGIKYLSSRKFRRASEHEADYIAIKNGFKKEIIAAKKFLFGDQLHPDYRKKMQRYYLSLEDAELCPEEKDIMVPALELD